ncbi:MAG: hypothetical protein R2770_10330 [Acidimicrobiales bacterium]|nr:hypothetical protein [Acidimicrobiales bacterium]
MPSLAVLLSHQGGWDEVLLYGAPLVIAIAILWGLSRYAKRKAAEAPAEGD